MVLCKDECTYEDPWADFYSGPSNKDFSEAKAARQKDSERASEVVFVPVLTDTDKIGIRYTSHAGT